MNAINPQSVPNLAAQTRILLAEDEPTNMAILSAFLQSADFEVVEAVNGKIAWDILSKDSNFDLLVTDHRMPEMEGLDLAIRMRNDARLKKIPVIMQTSATEPEEVLKGIRAGVYYYLAKPYEEEILLGIVRSAVQERRQKAQIEERMARQYEAMSVIVNADMHVRTLGEVENLSLLLGSICTRPDLAASGFFELLLNAVEHGNLGVGFRTKNKLLSSGTWEQEVRRLLDLPENKPKKVVVHFKRSERSIEVIIQDEGPGFDWRPYLEIDPARATQINGRGIAKASLLSFDRVEFMGNGNTVKITTTLKS